MKTVVAALILLLLPGTGFAQLPATGDTVRITTQRQFEAQWLRIDSDSARLIVDGAESAVKLDQITSLHVRERKPATIRGLIIGAAFGAVIYTTFGALVYDVTDDLCDEVLSNCTEDGSDYKLVNVLIGGGVGGLAGALVGSLMTTTRWREIEPPRR